jgi:Leucine-rich repeat (LRR) protein
VRILSIARCEIKEV